jgi:HEAT repeat protein
MFRIYSALQIAAVALSLSTAASTVSAQDQLDQAPIPRKPTHLCGSAPLVVGPQNLGQSAFESADTMWERATSKNDIQAYRVFRYHFAADPRSTEADRIISSDLAKRHQIFVPIQLSRSLPPSFRIEAVNSAPEPTRPAAPVSLLVRLMRDRLAVRATSTMERLITHSDPVIREMTIERAGKMGAEWLVSEIVAARSDPSPAVRRSAALALGRIGSMDSVDALGRLLSEDGESAVREAAAVALGAIGGWRSAQMLVGQAVHDPKRDVTKAAGEALRGEYEAEASKHLVEFLDAEQPQIRRATAVALGYVASPASTMALTCALEDREESVRAEAAWALGAVADHQSGRALAARLRDQSWSVRRAAVLSLGALGDAKWLPDVSRVTQDSQIAVRQAAVESLGHFGSKSPLEQILRFAGDASPGVRIGAARALGVLVNSDAVPALRNMLKTDPVSAVRLSAADALFKYPTINTREFTVDARDRDLREAIVRLAVRQTEPSDGVPTSIRDAAVDGDSGIRNLAIEGLGRFKDATAQRIATEALDDSDPLVSASAASVLAHTVSCSDVALLWRAHHAAGIVTNRAVLADAVDVLVDRCGLNSLRSAINSSRTAWYPYAVAEMFRVMTDSAECSLNEGPIPQGVTAISELLDSLISKNHSRRCQAAEGLLADPDPFVQIAASTGILDSRLRQLTDEMR